MMMIIIMMMMMMMMMVIIIIIIIIAFKAYHKTSLSSELQLGCCNGPGVVQRRDRQKKEFHDQSDYR